MVASEASTSGGGGERLLRRGSRGRRRPALASEPQLAVLLLVFDHVRQVVEEVLAVSAYQYVRNICGGKIDDQIFDFHTGEPILITQRATANIEKGEFSQLPMWMRLRGFNAWGHQTGPFAGL